MSDLNIYDTTRSVAVSSSAGSGKTYTLTSRLLAMLLSGVELSQVLAITFTNAAANDIREELFERIEEIERGKPSEVELFSSLMNTDEKQVRQRAAELRLKLVKQFSLLQISTIHSFFTRIIGCFPKQTGIVDFTIIDDFDREMLLEQSFVGFFDKLHHDEILANRMYTMLTSRDERGLKVSARFRNTYDLVHNRYFMFESIVKALGENIEIVEKEFFKNRSYLTSQRYGRIIESLASTVDAYLKALGEKKNPRSFARKLEEFLQSGIIRVLTDCYAFMDYRDGNLKNYLQRIARDLPDGDRFKDLFHDAWRGLSNFHMSEMQYRIYTWLDVYMLVQDIYNSLKGASHVIDYADIELIARDFLLRLEDYGYFRSRLESGIRYILIDEFQDTSELQWSALRPLIANCIEGGGALFYVGDVKQSIYRWRGGEPFLFNRARKEFGIHEEILPYSYRQNRTLLDFVNDVFNALGEKSDSRFVYSEQHLPPHLADKERGYVFLRGIGGEEELAAEILKQIHSLEQGGVAVDDIAILCRTNNEVGMIETLLRDNGIAFNSAGKTRLLDDYCVRDILNAIGFVLHPDETLFLNGLLRAPFFRCSFPFLDELSEQGTGGTVQQLKAREPKLWEAVQDILRLSRYTTPAGFVMELYRELDMFVQYPDRREPLMAFLELAYEFESSRDNVRIMDFYRYLHENYERIVLSAGDHGGVTVQTIHSSKGLEYHSVIIPFLKQRFHAKLDGSFMYSRDDSGNIEHLAIAGKVYIHYHSDQQRIVRLQRENDIDYQTDEINTLYVALTRARENLIVLPQINVRSESVGTVLLHVARGNTDVGDGLRIGEIVASRDEGEKEKKQYVHVNPLKQPEAIGVPAWQDQEEVFSTAYRKSRRDGLIRGTLFHAVIERINDLPLNEVQLETLLAVSAAREGRGYTKEELASAIRDVRPMVLNVIADPDLAKYFSDRAIAELSIVSDRYQNLLGRIDRIYMGKEIEVIDFKTKPVQDDSEHERLVESYREQIDAYCSVLAEIYPNRQVHGYLYFTGAVKSKRMVEVWRKT